MTDAHASNALPRWFMRVSYARPLLSPLAEHVADICTRLSTRADHARELSGTILVPSMTDFASGRFARDFVAGWATMDFNGHMANTAYLNLAADVRMAFFAEHGFPPGEFRRLAIGPVIQKDELEYFREV